MVHNRSCGNSFPAKARRKPIKLIYYADLDIGTSVIQIKQQSYRFQTLQISI